MDVGRFAARLKELRKAKGMTQNDLVESSGISLGTIRDLEQERNEPSWRTVLALCSAFGVDCTAFTEEPAEQPKPKRGRPAKATTEEPATKPKPKAKPRKKS